MGKSSRHSWLDAVKKAFRSPSNDHDKRSRSRRDDSEPEEEEEKKKGRKRWLFRRQFSMETTTIQHNVAVCANSSAVRICSGEENLVRKQAKMESPVSQQTRAFEVAMAAEAAVATAQAAVEIIRLRKSSILVKQDHAAAVIQKFFRGYLARRALLALKGVVKLQALIRGHNVRKRAKTTLQCIQSLIRVQALVCDQRRRLATTFASTFSHDSSSVRNSISRKMSRISSNFDVEEIHALIQKAKECSLKQGNMQKLAHALSPQISELEEVWFRKDRNLCHQIKTVEVDDQNLDSVFLPTPNHGKHLSLAVQSPRTPSSSSKIKSIHRMSMSENSCPLPRPNYMAATASAIARVTTTPPPQRRLSSPSRESARKRLSFPVHDAPNFQRCRAIQFDDEQRSDPPNYATD